jgi:hypothetical protein
VGENSSLQRLIVLFSAHLRADFDLLPRVSSTIQQIRATVPQARSPILLLDLGNAWAADSWACQVTGNRAPYLILDAMGYTAAHADGLDGSGIVGLQEVVQVRLLDDHRAYRWQRRNLTLNIGPTGEAPCVTWPLGQPFPSNAALYVAEHGRLTLFPQAGALGIVEVEWPQMQVVQATTIPFDRAIRPDPSIAACVGFVEREARFYAEKKKGGQANVPQ